MKKKLWTVLFFLFSIVIVINKGFSQNALDRYVAEPDSVYAWKLINTIEGKGYKSYILELTSQTWRKPSEVDKTVWKHWINIIKPDKITTNKALLYIAGGGNSTPAPTKTSPTSAMLALESNAVIVELGMVPNQPLRFSDSKDVERTEDDLIAYTYNKMADTKDPYWLVRLAMVKSGVRAMDAVQEFLKSDAGGKTIVDEFVVMGGSKRGWTTWLVGAVDKRVVAIMPAVIDALNTDATTVHHYEVYGFFSEALNDYVNHGIIPHLVNKEANRAVMELDDPYYYRNRERLKIPKYVMNASGDQYFLPDNSHYYFKGLQSPKYLRYVPNTKHNLGDSDAYQTLLAFFQAIINQRTLPTMSWKIKKNGNIVMKTSETPKEINVWTATNPKARDFRLDVIGKAFKKTNLPVNTKNKYVALAPKPEKGYAAFYIEMVFENGKFPLKFTSEVSVVPNVTLYKFEDSYNQYADKRRK